MKNEIKYFNFGNGPKHFVIIPGASLKPVSLNREAVEEAYKEFASNYKVYLFDYVETVCEGSTAESIAEEIAKKMKELGIKNAYVFGASLGGCIGQCLAINYPELVDKLLLGSTYSKQNEITKKVFSRWEELALKGDAKALTRDIQKVNYSPSFYNKFKKDFEAQVLETTKEETARFFHIAKVLLSFDKYNELDKIKSEVFLIGAQMDETVGKQASIEIAQKIKCPIYIYEGYGHCVYDEAPDYRNKIKEFFESKYNERNQE